MKKVDRWTSATNIFFAKEAEPSQPMLELTYNHDRTEPYDNSDGVKVTVEPKTLNAGRRERLQDRVYRGSRRLQHRAGRARHHEVGEMYQ